QKQAIARRDEEQAPVGQPVDAAGEGRRVQDDLAVALDVERDDLRRTPVGEPEAVLVPARLLAEHEACHERLRLRHRRRHRTGRGYLRGTRASLGRVSLTEREGASAAPLAWDGRRLKILDQTLLPFEERVIALGGADDTTAAIRRLSVRGAPLIGIAAAYGLAMEVAERPSRDALEERWARLSAAWRA